MRLFINDRFVGEAYLAVHPEVASNTLSYGCGFLFLVNGKKDKFEVTFLIFTSSGIASQQKKRSGLIFL